MSVLENTLTFQHDDVHYFNWRLEALSMREFLVAFIFATAIGIVFFRFNPDQLDVVMRWLNSITGSWLSWLFG